MELSSKSESGVNILYCESLWTSKKQLIINGKEALKIGKKQFQTDFDGEVVSYTVKGSFLTGVSVVSSSGEVTVLARNTWYDWLMICLPLVGIIFGVIFCGAIGGGASALLCMLGAVVNAIIARSRIKTVAKIFAQIGVAVLANALWFGIWYVAALLILSAL